MIIQNTWPVFVLFLTVFGLSALACAGLLWRLARARSLPVPERRAWFTLGVLGVSLIAYLALYLIVTQGFGQSARPLFAIFLLYGMTGFHGFLVRRERREGRIVLDECDRIIHRMASFAAYSAYLLVIVFGCLAPFLLKATASAQALRFSEIGVPILVGMLIVSTVDALTTVLLYRRLRYSQAPA